MLQHEIEGLGTCFFAKLRQQCDVAAEDCLQARANSPKDRARAHHDPTHHAQSLHYAKSVKLELSCDHGMRHDRSRSCVPHRHKKAPVERVNRIQCTPSGTRFLCAFATPLCPLRLKALVWDVARNDNYNP